MNQPPELRDLTEGGLEGWLAEHSGRTVRVQVQASLGIWAAATGVLMRDDLDTIRYHVGGLGLHDSSADIDLNRIGGHSRIMAADDMVSIAYPGGGEVAITILH